VRPALDWDGVKPHPQVAERESIANETIVAISTPPGRGGIGIVRLSGPHALEIGSGLFTLRNPLAHAQARFAEILDPESGSKLDEAIVTYFARPNSYTGEDLVEIAAHGSPVVLELLVRLSLQRGARLARPGEFTERAFLSGRIDLTQAEAVRDLIESQTLYQARVAAEQMSGALSRRLQPAKQNLVELIALLEAGIDFAEDDVDVTPDTEIVTRIDTSYTELEKLARSFEHGRIVHSGLTLAIVGRPNVGKSSLFNRLVERERAIVTAMPGTTRDLVTERVSLGGIPLELVDTAGLREATDEAESIGIQKSREALADADVVLVVLEAGVPLRHDEAELIDSLSTRRALIARNKSDLALAEDSAPDLPLAAVATSAINGDGMAELREALLGLVRNPAGESESGMLTNLRHHEAVAAAIAGLSAAKAAIGQRIPHEMLLLDLYAALRQLDSLTGETAADDILNRIFSTFCIGK
jgi:tRNA modification GTPase